MSRLISRVYELGSAPPATAAEKERARMEARREAWHRHGLIVLDPADVTDDWLRLAITHEADRRYGRRKGKGN